jgi:hypothetical protein
MRVQRREADKRMKRIFLTLMILEALPIGSMRAQLKSVESHPFIQWEMRQIGRIDSLGNANRQRGDSEMDWLMDSISNLKYEHRADVFLKLDAMDTLENSGLIEANNFGWRNWKVNDLLDSVYNLILSQSSDAEKAALRTDERKWLKRRDRYFEKAERRGERESAEVEGGRRFSSGRTELAEMGYNYVTADFIAKRLRYLATKMKS